MCCAFVKTGSAAAVLLGVVEGAEFVLASDGLTSPVLQARAAGGGRSDAKTNDARGRPSSKILCVRHVHSPQQLTVEPRGANPQVDLDQNRHLFRANEERRANCFSRTRPVSTSPLNGGIHRRSLDRKLDGKSGSASEFALYLDCSLVRLHDVFDDRQSQSRPAHFARAASGRLGRIVRRCARLRRVGCRCQCR